MFSQGNKSGLRNPWVWGMLAAITVVLTVNSTFIWFAEKGTRSALVDRDYETGDRTSNDEMLAELSTLKSLSWQTEIKKPESVVVGKPTLYNVFVKDREGKPVSAKILVTAYRASDASKDFTTAFKEVSPGHYQGYINFSLKGYWELHILVQRGEERSAIGVTNSFMVDAAS